MCNELAEIDLNMLRAVNEFLSVLSTVIVRIWVKFRLRYPHMLLRMGEFRENRVS